MVNPLESGCLSKGIQLQSPHYVALGCDLANTDAVFDTSSAVIDNAKCMVLCVAEVSVTYMNTEAADSLIKCTSQFDDGQCDL